MNNNKIIEEIKENLVYRDVLSCMRCGLCLNNCATFETFRNDEANSPRGRVALMRGIIEGTITPDEEIREVFDNCLLCKKCVEVCPSGVKYGKLITEARNIFDIYK